MKNYKIQIIIEATLSSLGSSGISLFQINCVFGEYDLFKPAIFLQNLIYSETLRYGEDNIAIETKLIPRR